MQELKTHVNTGRPISERGTNTILVTEQLPSPIPMEASCPKTEGCFIDGESRFCLEENLK